ncbi:MAG: phospholipase effector Tle1 domain-containing protein, partial [Hyphomicrobiales bacterium]
IVIFSDGTAQAGGLMPDERRTNVYKLFRATRVGPDTDINPEKQQAFYDPGLGSSTDGKGLKNWPYRLVYGLLSKMTGLGITRNIIDRYAEIVRLYEPGDRIFLLGFSRGAYTVRCVGGVMALCGVPTTGGGDKPLKRDAKSVRAIAAEGVETVYKHGSGRKAERFKEQRIELGKLFREKYGANSKDSEKSNVVPHFIGVLDTVASPGYNSLIALGVFIVMAVMAACLVWLSSWLSDVSFWRSFIYWFAFEAVVFAVLYVRGRLKFTNKIKGTSTWDTLHLTGTRMEFYNTDLNPDVEYAKHALAIDEKRKNFDRVPWSPPGKTSGKKSAWFEQIWFAGNHSDIVGSYPENEARLSDISLKWVVEKATGVKPPLEVDFRFLNAHPSSAGLQHDELKRSIIPWPEKLRCVPPDAILHPTVIERFKLSAIVDYDQTKKYRPENLRPHKDVAEFYAEGDADEPENQNS